MTIRIFNVLIGTWLFLSSFAWPHPTMQRYAAMICGALTVALSLLTIFNPSIRYLTAVLAVGLFVETLVTAHAPRSMTFLPHQRSSPVSTSGSRPASRSCTRLTSRRAA